MILEYTKVIVCLAIRSYKNIFENQNEPAADCGLKGKQDFFFVFF